MTPDETAARGVRSLIGIAPARRSATVPSDGLSELAGMQRCVAGNTAA